MSETVHNTTKVLLFPKSISRSCLLRDAERDLLVIAKFLVMLQPCRHSIIMVLGSRYLLAVCCCLAAADMEAGTAERVVLFCHAARGSTGR